MLLHILRHAEAEAHSSTGLDADRALTAAGAKRMKAVARGIAALEVRYDAVLISPLLRARQTAEPVMEACGFRDEATVTNALLPSATPESVLEELAELKARAALLVGHQPHMGRLFGRLVSGRGDVELPMKKAALAGFEYDPHTRQGALLYYLPARLTEMFLGVSLKSS